MQIDMRRSLAAIALSACLVLQLGGCVTTGSSSARFEGLGDLPGGTFASFAAAVSADGSTVAGQGSVADGRTEAFRWAGGRMQSLGVSQPGASSLAEAISADGSTIVGTRFFPTGASPSQAVVWRDGTLHGLNGFPCGDLGCSASGVSGDGSIVIGQSRWRNGERERAFLWTREDGMQDLQELIENRHGADLRAWVLGRAEHVSDDATVIAGLGLWNDTAYDAYRWVEGGSGEVSLSGLGSVSALSPEGFALAGNIGTRFARSGDLVLWTDRETAVLSVADGGPPFIAEGMSSCGTTVVGFGDFGDGEEAFLWTAADGMQRLKTVLETDYRLDLTGWTLRRAEDTSNDGSVIVGSGINPDGNHEAWRAVLHGGKSGSEMTRATQREACGK
ncbi:hypothetical protein [Marilutibacter maris]|nr:hypothetical protein [Lysobacter maris]